MSRRPRQASLAHGIGVACAVGASDAESSLDFSKSSGAMSGTGMVGRASGEVVEDPSPPARVQSWLGKSQRQVGNVQGRFPGSCQRVARSETGRV